RRPRRVRFELESLEDRALLNAAWWTPPQIKAAYGFNNVGSFSSGGVTLPADGRGQTIAIVDAYDDPNIAADLKSFSKAFVLPQMDGKNGDPTLKVIGQDGGNVPPGAAPKGGPFAFETAMDVEWAHAIAPRANILLVEASWDTDDAKIIAN